MFDSLLSAGHEIAEFAAVSGLSIGGLVGCAAAFYFLAPLRPLAIAAAVTIIVGFGAFTYGEHDGRTDVLRQWNEANAKAAAAAKQRDADQAKAADADAAKAEADLAAKHKTDQETVDDLRNQDASCHPITGDQLR